MIYWRKLQSFRGNNRYHRHHVRALKVEITFSAPSVNVLLVHAEPFWALDSTTNETLLFWQQIHVLAKQQKKKIPVHHFHLARCKTNKKKTKQIKLWAIDCCRRSSFARILADHPFRLISHKEIITTLWEID